MNGCGLFRGQVGKLDGLIDPSLDTGEVAAKKCMQWVNWKILEHIGFQSASSFS